MDSVNLNELKCQSCKRRLFFFIPRLNLSHFNTPLICKDCNSINMMKGEPNLEKFDYVSAVGSMFFIALVFIVISFEPAFFKNPFFYLVLVAGVLSLNFLNYVFFRQYISSVNQLNIEEAINYLKNKDVSSSFRLPRLLSLRTFLWILILFVMLCALIFFNRGEAILFKFLSNLYIYPSLFIGALIGHLPLRLLKKALIRSMEKQKEEQIKKIEKLRSL